MGRRLPSLIFLTFLLASTVLSRAGSYGEAQVQLVLKDRPRLAFYVKTGNPIWTWLVDAFNRPNGGYKIVWDPKPTSSFNPYGGECQTYAKPQECGIRVDRAYKSGRYPGVDIGPDKLLSTLVFELCNARELGDAALQIDAKACLGIFDRRQFAIEMAHREYLAEMDSQDFLSSTFLPFCSVHHIEYAKEFWIETLPDFKTWLARYPASSYYPWTLYGDHYDELIKEFGISK